MTPEVVIHAVAALIATITAIVALRTYIKDVQHKQVHWLYELFEDFYKNDIYIAIRQTLTMGSTDTNGIVAELKDVRDALLTEPTPKELIELADDVCDYLNFFEFVCSLVQTGRMKRRDMESLFDYYLDNLAKHEFILRYLGDDKNGFEGLRSELWRYHVDKIPAAARRHRPSTLRRESAISEILATKPVLATRY